MLRNQGVRAFYRVLLSGILLLGANTAVAQTISFSTVASEATIGTEITFSGSFPGGLNLPANGTEYRLFRCNTDRGVTPHTNLTGANRSGFGQISNCRVISTSGSNGFGTGKSRTLPTGSDAPKYTLVDADFGKHLYFAASTGSLFSVAPVYSPLAATENVTLTISGSKTAGEVMTVSIANRPGNGLKTSNYDFSIFHCINSPIPAEPGNSEELGCTLIMNPVTPASGSWRDATLTVTILSIATGGYIVIQFDDNRTGDHYSNEWGPIQPSPTTTVGLSGDKVVGAEVTVTLTGLFTSGATSGRSYSVRLYRCPSGIDVSVGLPKNMDGSVDTDQCPVVRNNRRIRVDSGATTGSAKQQTTGGVSSPVVAGDTLFAILSGRGISIFFTESAGYGPYAAGPEWGSGLTDSVTYPSSSRSVTLTWQRVDAASSSGRFPSHFRIYRHETADQVIHLASGFADKVWDDTPAMANCGTSSRNCSVTLTSQPWHSSGTMHYAIHSFTESGATTYTGTVSAALAVAVNAAPTATPAQTALDAAPLALMVGDSATSYSQTFAFSDMDVDVNDGDSLSLPTTASSSNSSVATATYNSSTGMVTVTPGTQQGSTLISVTAQDGAGASVSRSFMVTVNAPPMVVGETQRTLSLAAGTTMEVTMQFSDSGDDLTFTASSENTDRATVSPVSGNADADGMVTVTVTAVTPGAATDITVTARDETTGSTPASITFSVTVTSDPALGIDQSERQTQTVVRGAEIIPIALTALRFSDENALVYTLVAAGSESGSANLHGLSVGGNGTTTATVRGTPDRNGEIRFVVRATSGNETDDSEPIRISVTGGDTPSGGGSGTAPAPAPAAGGGGGGGAIAAIVIGAGVYLWWKKRQIANGNAAAMAVLPDVSFDLDRNDRRAFYTRMNWQNSGNSNWQLRGNAKIHTKYSGKLLDWHADSHIGYRLNGKFGKFNPYLRGKFVQNAPENAKMDETYTVGVNYAIPNRFSVQFLQPDDEIWRYSLKTEMHLPKGISLRFNQPNSDIWRYSANLNWQISERIGLNLSQPDNDLPNYGFGIQWRNKSKIRYGISGETGRNSYRLSGQFSF